MSICDIPKPCGENKQKIQEARAFFISSYWHSGLVSKSACSDITPLPFFHCSSTAFPHLKTFASLPRERSLKISALLCVCPVFGGCADVRHIAAAPIASRLSARADTQVRPWATLGYRSPTTSHTIGPCAINFKALLSITKNLQLRKQNKRTIRIFVGQKLHCPQEKYKNIYKTNY